MEVKGGITVRLGSKEHEEEVGKDVMHPFKPTAMEKTNNLQGSESSTNPLFKSAGG